MTKKTIIILISILLIGIAAIYFIVDFKSKKTDLWTAIPGNAAVIMNIDHPGKLFAKVTRENEVLESLLLNENIQHLYNEALFIDSLLNNGTSSKFSISKACISLHHNQKQKKANAVLYIDLDGEFSLETINKSLNNRYQLERLDDHSWTLKYTNSVKTAYVGRNSNILYISVEKSLFDDVRTQITSNENTLLKDADLIKLRSTAGSNPDATIFINYDRLFQILENYGKENFRAQLNWLRNFASWTEIDVILKNDEILMTGFTIANENKNQFLTNFSNLDPVQHSIANVLPFNTNMILRMGVPDFKSSPLTFDISTLSTQLNFDLNKIIGLLNGEIALANNATRSSKIVTSSWFIAGVTDKSKMTSYLNQLAKNTKGRYGITYSGYQIGKINNKELISGIFGSAFSTIKENWFTLVGDNVVFANSREGIEGFIRANETGKTLDLNEGFKSFSDNLSASSNLMLFIRPRDIVDKADTYSTKNTTNLIRENKQILQDFDGLVFQYSHTGEMFFTNFYLKNNKKFKEETMALWKVQLDDIITGKPFLVKDHSTGNFNVLVFDQSANVYLVSTDGKILWKKRVDALPESPIYEVDYYKNGKIQYLFNSQDFIYLIDKVGNYVSGYPKKLNPAASNGISLFDYNSKKDYRIVVAQSDKRVYNYKLDGKQVKGWSKPRTENLVLDRVQRLVADRKDYFLITDSDNKISIVNRKGNQRLKLKENPNKAHNSSFYINKTNSKGIILSTNTKGKLFYISTSGKLQYTDFGDFSTNHFFLYEDFNGDRQPDFIYVDGDKLFVFDRFKNILFDYQFESTISIKPEFFKLSNNNRVLGIVADQEKTIYLFDNKGNTLISKGLVGETPFNVGSLENSKELNLLTATGKTLYNYRID